MSLPFISSTGRLIMEGWSSISAIAFFSVIDALSLHRATVVRHHTGGAGEQTHESIQAGAARELETARHTAVDRGDRRRVIAIPQDDDCPAETFAKAHGGGRETLGRPALRRTVSSARCDDDI